MCEVLQSKATAKMEYIDGLVQDCSISSAYALEILQSCTNPAIYSMSDKMYTGL